LSVQKKAVPLQPLLVDGTCAEKEIGLGRFEEQAEAR